MNICSHDLANRETACADGMCPLCLAIELDKLREEIKKALFQLQSTQRNWDEDCLFNCNDILEAALKGGDK